MQQTPRSSPSHRPDKPLPRSKKVVNIAIATVVALILVGVSVFAMQQRQVVAQNTVAAEAYAPSFTPVAEEDDRPTALFVGDSYTHGTGVDTKEDRWSSIVARKMGWREANIGQGGTGYATTSGVQGCGKTFCAAYAETVRAFRTVPADIVVVAGGQNDFRAYNSDASTVQKGVSATFAQIERSFPDAQLVVVGPSTADEITDATRGLDRDIQNAARAAGATYISLLDPEVIEDDMVLEDGGHVGREGHAAIAERVLSELKED
ncbi:SGNH/GDSL hydrolase family protein [Kocuria rosea]|uniref:SGNH/GDSL hydrolase family protein n=1 Tax=Kocuria rosea TaxID=1275 RepID=UPI003018DFAD